MNTSEYSAWKISRDKEKESNLTTYRIAGEQGWSPEASESRWESGCMDCRSRVTSSGSRAVETCFHSMMSAIVQSVSR